MVSDTDEDIEISSAVKDKRRFGLFSVLSTTDEFIQLFSNILNKIPKKRTGPLNISPSNALHICIKDGNFASDADASSFLSNFLTSQEILLGEYNIRRVTVLVGNIREHNMMRKMNMTRENDKTERQDYLSAFTFRSSDHFVEDPLLRNIEAPHAFHLDLPRLANFQISLEVYVYNLFIYIYMCYKTFILFL
jgi:hypothetical protein